MTSFDVKFEKLAETFRNAVSEHPILCLYELLPKALPYLFKKMVHCKGRLNFHDCLIVHFLEEVPKVKFVTFDKDFGEHAFAISLQASSEGQG